MLEDIGEYTEYSFIKTLVVYDWLIVLLFRLACLE